MALNADLSAFISGGYFLAKRVSRPREFTDLMPDTFIRLSDCFTDIAPDTWADKAYNYDEGERSAEAAKFGIPAFAVPALVTEFTKAVALTHLTNSFPTLAIAREFHRRCTDKTLVVLLGIGLEPSLVASLRSQLHDDVNHGYGLIERIDAQDPLSSSGSVLGYEPLGFEAMKFHSWLCHNAPVGAYERFGTRPNRAGFIGSFADAVHVTEHLKATGAEPAIWEPWLVVQYDCEDKRFNACS